MLDQQDKKWILTALATQSQNLNQTITRVINDLRVELTEVMATGFAECSSSTETAVKIIDLPVG